MKTFEFDVDDMQAQWIFFPIRTKNDMIVLLMKTIKFMIVNAKYDPARVVGKVTLHVDKMSRLFFFSEKKHFSINFPFSVKDDEGTIKFQYAPGYYVDNKTSSEVLSVLASGQFFSGSSIYDFLDPVGELEADNSNFWKLMMGLIIFEDGYVRYDHDEDNARGDIHPLHHMDVFYSSGNSFKLGLNQQLAGDALIDMLNITTDCHFLTRK